MIDKVLATLSVLMLAAFLGIVIWFVAEPDLIIVAVAVLAMVVFDFWRSTRTKRNNGNNRRD